GLPLSLLRLERDHRYAALELGASASGEIEKLAGLCRPQIGVITRIGEAHLGGFGSQRQLAEAKAELLRALPANGLAVLNGDDPWLRQMVDRSAAPIVWIGRGSNCDYSPVDIRASTGQLEFSVENQRYQVP